MKTLAYWKRLSGTALLVMATGYWLLTAFTFAIPAWLVVPASVLGISSFLDWLSGRWQRDELMDWLQPAVLAGLTLVAYGLLTALNFLPSSALLVAVLVSTVLFDFVLDRLLGPAATPRPAVGAETSRA